jgi:hypothetical protein
MEKRGEMLDVRCQWPTTTTMFDVIILGPHGNIEHPSHDEVEAGHVDYFKSDFYIVYPEYNVFGLFV